jgi:hypothetical protein
VVPQEHVDALSQKVIEGELAPAFAGEPPLDGVKLVELLVLKREPCVSNHGDSSISQDA